MKKIIILIKIVFFQIFKYYFFFNVESKSTLKSEDFLIKKIYNTVNEQIKKHLLV